MEYSTLSAKKKVTNNATYIEQVCIRINAGKSRAGELRYFSSYPGPCTNLSPRHYGSFITTGEAVHHHQVLYINQHGQYHCFTSPHDIMRVPFREVNFNYLALSCSQANSSFIQRDNLVIYSFNMFEDVLQM